MMKKNFKNKIHYLRNDPTIIHKSADQQSRFTIDSQEIDHSVKEKNEKF